MTCLLKNWIMFNHFCNYCTTFAAALTCFLNNWAMFNCITFASLYICTTIDIIRLVCLYQAISCLEMACLLLSENIMYASSRCRTAILLARSFIFETSIWSDVQDVQMYIVQDAHMRHSLWRLDNQSVFSTGCTSFWFAEFVQKRKALENDFFASYHFHIVDLGETSHKYVHVDKRGGVWGGSWSLS